MTKSFFERFSPFSIGKGLWGPGKMPTHWKLLFTVQSCIFVSALWMRQVDVQNAQRRKNGLENEENTTVEGKGDTKEALVSHVSKEHVGR
ncbi:hypothetical protein HJC23_003444 [Cyclotella cryptica]|uniref:Uncharacterized protein n=1 Tax=Cyclotella cryptica TaxID=29204 RepID=A0ABD3QS11_9STRA